MANHFSMTTNSASPTVVTIRMVDEQIGGFLQKNREDSASKGRRMLPRPVLPALRGLLAGGIGDRDLYNEIPNSFAAARSTSWL